MANMNPKKTPIPEQDAKVRATNFEEVTLGYTEEMAIEEAKRCLNCKNPLCRSGCPVSVRIPEFIEKVAEGEEAHSDIISVDNVDPVMGKDLRNAAIKSAFLAILFMLIYIAIRFDKETEFAGAIFNGTAFQLRHIHVIVGNDFENIVLRVILLKTFSGIVATAATLTHKDVVIIDATAPHSHEPKFPGVGGTIIDLSIGWDLENLDKDKIIGLTDEKKKLYMGRDEFGRMGYFASDEDMVGKFVMLRITKANGISLFGEIEK